jgi:hypothetical protein
MMPQKTAASASRRNKKKGKLQFEADFTAHIDE